MKPTLTNLGFLLTVSCPYSASFNKGAKLLGGRWNPHERLWEFQPRALATVNQLLDRCFTQPGTEQSQPPTEGKVAGHWRQQRLSNGRTKRVWVRAHLRELN